MLLSLFLGERRIRVHTMCLPIASTISEVIQSADQQCIVGLLAKMGKSFSLFFYYLSFNLVDIIRLASFIAAVDRCLQSSIGDARDALVNVCVDVLTAYKAAQGSTGPGLHAPTNLRLLPLYIAALLKSVSVESLSIIIPGPAFIPFLHHFLHRLLSEPELARGWMTVFLP